MSEAARLAGKRLWIGISGTSLDATTREHLEAVRPGGVVLFARNVVDAEQTRRLVGDLRELLGEDLRVSVDQEGGLVVRFSEGLTVFPGNMALGAASFRETSLGAHLATEQGRTGARELAALGIDTNLAPVLDLMTIGGNPGIGTRSFGAHPELAIALGRALIAGSQAEGVLCTLKHFPGKGTATADAHISLPTIGKDTDLQPHQRPFRELIAAGAALVMSSHVIFEGLDPEVPATFSRRIAHELLREEMGFEGPLVTDDLEMGAMVSYFGFEDVVRRAAASGHDFFCIAHRYDRQALAHRLLTRAYEEKEAWAGDPEAIESRRLALPAPRPAGPLPAPQDGGAIAAAIAGRAVTVVSDPRGLLPIAGKKCLLALPVVEAETGVEDPLRGEDPAALAGLLETSCQVYRLSGAPDGEEISALLDVASGYERLLLVTTLARFQPAQTDLLLRATREHPGVIHLPLRNPFDAEVLPPDPGCAVVTPYGFRPVHLRALAPVLDGRHEPYGRLPVHLEPLG